MVSNVPAITSLIVLVTIFGVPDSEPGARWGFYGHKLINRTAVYSLPGEMILFYKRNITFIEEKAVNPDMRRYVNPEEAPRHFIDLDRYPDFPASAIPKYWDDAVEKYSEDTLKENGIVPWHLRRVCYYLTNAFRRKDAKGILKLSADLGHYVGDANVPLHTTSNYNGQLTGQHGIHGFWESRLPELFAGDYDLFVGKADYERDIQGRAWEAVYAAHVALDSVLLFEANLTEEVGDHLKYSVEQRGQRIVKTYSYNFSERYHKLLAGMVERQMRKAIRMTADLWYTCWVNAGQPDLAALDLTVEDVEPDTLAEPPGKRFRNHESNKKP